MKRAEAKYRALLRKTKNRDYVRLVAYYQSEHGATFRSAKKFAKIAYNKGFRV